MHAAERETLILRLLSDRGFVGFQELERQVAASPATLRRDLGRLVEAGRIELKCFRTLEEVVGDDSGVTGVRLRNAQSGEIEALGLQGCFIAIGHHPNTDLFKDQLDMRDGYVVTRAGLQG
ncbi:MAG: DeoR family transcriptional regulator, partial [Alphaproteobacteria bacterium]|nr:DeoR family transcriptional regulator [Alphaproteobacteria bacterium]